MLMTQVYTILNTITGELLGEGVVVNEDLTNIVEIGNTFANTVGLDNYVKSLNDHIGRMVFKDRIYKGRAPSVMMDGWEFGSILEKISPDLPDATENESWDLVNGQSYDPNVFYKPSVSVSCWNKRVTFEVPVSITEKQVKSSFQSATQLNAFFSMIYNAIQNSITIKNDALIMRTINNFIVETIFADYGAVPLGTKSGTKAVNLLYLYNTLFTKTLTPALCLTDPDFLKFAALTMGKYVDRMKVMSTLFNIGAKERFTPDDALHVVMLSEFKKAADVYLQSETFHNDMTALPNAETVPYWQGSGTDYAFASTSKIDVKSSANHTVATEGILCVMFDRDALGVTNLDPRVTTQYNAKAEFWNEYHKVDAGYFNDTNENFVVFFVSDDVA
jgi:hypothetical protein